MLADDRHASHMTCVVFVYFSLAVVSDLTKRTLCYSSIVVAGIRLQYLQEELFLFY